jgi:hypothetical protein
MDFDGIMHLMERDVERFEDWKKKSENFSLEELRESTNEWIVHYGETYQKYKDTKLDDKEYDRVFLTAKMAYFHYLANYALNAIGAYVEKLQKEISLQSQKKVGKKKRKKQ